MLAWWLSLLLHLDASQRGTPLVPPASGVYHHPMAAAHNSIDDIVFTAALAVASVALVALDEVQHYHLDNDLGENPQRVKRVRCSWSRDATANKFRDSFRLPYSSTSNAPRKSIKQI